MRRRVDVVIDLLSIIIILMVTMLLTGCMTAKGLHSNNRGRNATVKWQQYHEHGQHYVR